MTQPAEPANLHDAPFSDPDAADAPIAPSTETLAQLERDLAELEAELAAIDAADGSDD